MRREALILAAVLLTAAPGWAQPYTLRDNNGVRVVAGVYDRVTFTWQAPGDGTLTLFIQARITVQLGDGSTPEMPTTTVVDGNGAKVASASSDEIRFDVLEGVTYTISLEYPPLPHDERHLVFTWLFARPTPPEDDVKEGGPGNDRLNGGPGSDILEGYGGDDTLKGGQGKDWMWGGSGNDRLEGGKGHDVMWGGDDDDVLIGGRGNDGMIGGGGDDILKGGRGNDRLLGGWGGDDILTGGKGKDLFVFGPLPDGFMLAPDSGHKVITDFERGERIMLDGEGWPSVADIIASVVAKGSRHYVYVLSPPLLETDVHRRRGNVYTEAPGLTLETDVRLRAEDFVVK